MANHLTSRELADRWKLHIGTLANWRTLGKGPKYIKMGKKILYAQAEVEAFEAERVKDNTLF